MTFVAGCPYCDAMISDRCPLHGGETPAWMLEANEAMRRDLMPTSPPPAVTGEAMTEDADHRQPLSRRYIDKVRAALGLDEDVSLLGWAEQYRDARLRASGTADERLREAYIAGARTVCPKFLRDNRCGYCERGAEEYVAFVRASLPSERATTPEETPANER